MIVRILTAVALCVAAVGSGARLSAATITINYSTAPGADGQLTYIDNPGTTNPAGDSFFANIISPEFGNGTLSVPNDFTNYATATEHADLATFTFASGTFSGAEDAVINLALGSVSWTFAITAGTGAFTGASGTLSQSSQFTSFGSFSPNVPATEAITSGGGTLSVSAVPEPVGGGVALALSLLCAAHLGKRKKINQTDGVASGRTI